MIIKTKSVCPECKEVIDAELFEKDGTIYMRKVCPTHGEFIERITDVGTLQRDSEYLKLLYKYIPSSDIPNCPYGCETCRAHKSPTVLGIVDVTNRCNLRCSYCFANAAVSGWLFEPDLETIKKEIDFLVNMDPPAPAVLFSGGEPTMREDFIDIVRYARDKGLFILIATNGYKIASSLEYTKKLAEAGPPVIYLSFDGLTDESNKEKKNHLIIEKILDHCKQAGIGVVLVPAVIKGINEDQIWPIIKFASEHMDVVRGVNFQPISFCGRMSKDAREKQRFTISDLKHTLETQSGGIIKVKDWYPIPVVLPFTKLFEGITGKKAVTFSSHPLCGEATYLFKNDDGSLIPITEFVDVDRFISLLDQYAEEIKNTNNISKSIKLLSLVNKILGTIDFDKAPKSIQFKELLKNVLLHPGDMGALTEFHTRTLFIGCMHFQDLYNLDIERLKYCTIHYITPDLTRIPFCAYNGDLGYRERVENRHRRPFVQESH